MGSVPHKMAELWQRVSAPREEVSAPRDSAIKPVSPDSLRLALTTEPVSINLVKKTEGGGLQQLYYHDCLGRIPGHTTREPQVGFELETKCF